MKVLIIEDDELITDILMEYLEGAGYSYVCSGNGAEGLEALQQHDDIDVILLDRMMPEMNGIEFMQRIQENPAYADIPVIMQSAAAGTHEVIEGSQAGVYYYLTKPYSESMLLSVLRDAYEHRRNTEAVA